MHDLLQRYRHIAIEGPIGVGKTSLATRLAAALGADLLLERPDANPFLERFYDDPTRHALQAQLAFLFQRVEQMHALAQPGMFSRGVVSDFLFAKDALFARLTLDDDDHRLYTRVAAHLIAAPPPPDLVIWLQAEPATLMQRIRRRGLGMEQRIGEDYLQRLADAYAEHFTHPIGAPLLIVATERFNPADDAADLQRLLATIASIDGPRTVLDPSPPPDLAPPAAQG